MKRRTVLKAGMGGLVGMAAVESGCATAPPRLDHVPEVDPEAAEAALARIDERMASFDHLDFDIPQDVPHHVRQTLETKAALARRALRSLYLAGAFQQLDEPLRYHPGMQERVRRMQGEMDETVQHATEHLASLSPAERKQIQQRLAAEPGLGQSVAEHLQEVAKEDGFRFSHRAQLRYALTDVERRMRTQSTSAVIDRSVERARAARGRTDWMDERTYVAQLGETTFRDLKQRAFVYAARWEHVYAARPRFDLARMDAVYPDDGGGAGVPTREDFQGERASKPPPPAASPQQQPQTQAQAQAQAGYEPNSTGRGVLTVGGWMLGIGALIEVGGLVLYFGPGASISALQFLGGIMCIYLGPALLVASLLVLVVGAVMAFAVPAPKSAPPSETTPEKAPSAAPSAPQI